MIGSVICGHNLKYRSDSELFQLSCLYLLTITKFPISLWSVGEEMEVKATVSF